MTNRILIIIVSIIIFPLIVYLIGMVYFGYSIYSADKNFFSDWEQKEFFSNEYIMMVRNINQIENAGTYNQKYLDADFLSENKEMRLNNLIIKNIELIKIKDTLIKPQNSKSLFIVKKNRKISLEYKWSWNE